MLAALCLLTGAARAESETPTQAVAPSLKIAPAKIDAAAGSSMILGAALAGNRIVAVGEHGVVLLSDDAGVTYRQAKSVPIAATLTSVHFVDAKTGWAAGHWGTILKTTDGGESWALQRKDINVDQPLFSIYFKNAKNGWAAGLWSLLLCTHDGGATWEQVSLPVPAEAAKAERNLFAIFPDREGGIAIAAERGTIVRSVDEGKTWTYIDTGYKGSLWAGTVLDDGTWLVGGLRGTILRSADHGKTWQLANTGSKSSVTGILPRKGRTLSAIALDGVLLSSSDDGLSFSATQSTGQEAITAAVVTPNGKLAEFSESGPLKVGQATAR